MTPCLTLLPEPKCELTVGRNSADGDFRKGSLVDRRVYHEVHEGWD